MSFLQNLHTHCEWCDGRNTAEETIESAISMGVDSIGFSAHVSLPFRPHAKTLKNEDIPVYRRYIRSLAAGFREVYVYTQNGFRAIPLDTLCLPSAAYGVV